MAIFGRSDKNHKAPSKQPAPALYAAHPTHEYLHIQQPGSSAPQIPPRPQTSNGVQYAPIAPGWGPPPQSHPYQQVFVSNYILPPSQPLQPTKPQRTGLNGRKFMSASAVDLPMILQGDVPSCIPGAQIFNDGIPAWHRQGTQYLNQGAALYDLISSKFNAVVTMIDGENFSGDERELWVSRPSQPAQQWQVQQAPQPETSSRKVAKSKNKKKDDGCPIAAAVVSSNYFTKVNLYANSRLPPNLPMVKLYIPTFPLLCLAAQYSERVYNKPSGAECEAHVESDWRVGTKAMVIKSVPMDDMNVIVFAIRGSQTFLDWAVNLNSAPSAPTGFLDDAGNFCHAGFLSVARRMIAPVAARLRRLLEEDPRRAQCSLLMTGHSAGGAVAALLYSHMLATTKDTESELNILTGCFKRIHCVTFGAPPVSLLPLVKPDRRELRKSLFLSFVNEGDPVTRADKAYVKSLLDLYATMPPGSSLLGTAKPSKLKPLLRGKSSSSLNVNKIRPSRPAHANSAPTSSAPIWRVPPSALSNAGRLILLRAVPRRQTYPNDGSSSKGGFLGGNCMDRMDDGVQARSITDEDLRGVVFGDPVCHMMKLYARRIEVLATNAVIGRA